MRLRYTDLTGRAHTITARITTDHPASHYGIPVVVLPDGEALDYASAAMLSYEVIKASPKEMELLQQWQAAMPPIGGAQ